MKRLVKYCLFLIIFALGYINVNALELSLSEYESLNIKRSYVVGRNLFDISYHNPTLKDLMLSARTFDNENISIIEIKIARDIDGNITRTYTDILNNVTYTSFPVIDIDNIYRASIKDDNTESEKLVVRDLFYANVTFMDGNDEVETKEVRKGTSVSASTLTTKTGYVFDNWYANASFENLFNFSAKVYDDTYAYGKWNANEYTINFNDNVETEVVTVPASITKTYGTDYDLTNTTAPQRNGYEFLGWSANAEATTASFVTSINSDLTTGTDAQTLYAVWHMETYDIEIDLGGGETSTENATTYDVTTGDITLVEPTKEGYTFDGWTGSNGTTPQKNITIEEGSFGDKTYVASWTANEYTINFDDNVETEVVTVPASITKTYGVDYDLTSTTAPQRNGYEFLGWSADAGATSASYTTSINSDLTTGTDAQTLYAIWNEEIYAISYDLNDGAVETANPNTYTINTNTFTLNNPTKTGSTFTGWTGSNGTTAQTTVTIEKGSFGNLSFQANWEEN